MTDPDSPNNALPAGTQVGQFVIRQALGAGGFGITYVAVDVHLNRDVVIKENFPSFYAAREHDTLTVCPSSTSNTELFEKSLISFTNEAKMIASLKHPNIVNIFSIFDAYGTVFFAMPYHQGGSLSQFVKAFHQPNYTPLKEEQLRAYLIPILEALQYMHAHNVYHRDIKPDNILIDEKTGDPILIDFGAARELLDDKTQAATIVATFGFAAPEQIMALKIGPYTDLYALAATMYALMTGKIPERGDARLLFEDKHKKLADDLLMQTRYSLPFLQSIDKALEADWKKRPQTAQEWLDTLQKKTSFWNPKRILSLAAILILMIISAIFILSNPDQEEIAKTPIASHQQQPITKAPATTERNSDKALQTKDADNTPISTQTIEDFKTPVSKAIYQANINPNAQVKANAKYFIVCWGSGLFKMEQKRHQLLAATMDATEKDPNIQIIHVSTDFPLTENEQQDFSKLPTIFDVDNNPITENHSYRKITHTDSKAKIPWNSTIETNQKLLWEEHKKNGKVQGDFPMPDEDKKINSPWFLPTGCSPSFFIVDDQGKRVFPQDKVYANLETIWDAYKDLSTLTEEELKLSHDQYVTTEPAKTTRPKTDETPAPAPAAQPLDEKPLDDVSKPRTWTSSKNDKKITGQAISYDGSTVSLRINNNDVTSPKTNFSQEDQDWLNRHQEAIQQAKSKQEKTNSDSPNKDLNENPVARALQQANINDKAKINLRAKYFIFCWGNGLSMSMMDQRRFQLEVATMDAAQHDPNIQFIAVTGDVPENPPENLTTTPVIMDINLYDSRNRQKYLNALKPESKVKIPWNDALEKAYRRQWANHGEVKTDLPLPSENKKIDIPGLLDPNYRPSFFIVDAQGSRVVPTNEGCSDLESIWDAFSVLTTLSEEKLTESYNKYINTSVSKEDLEWLNQHQKAIKKEKLSNSKTNKDIVDYPVARSIQQANVNRKADTKIKLKAKYFIFSFDLWNKTDYRFKRHQLLRAVMDAEDNDPNIQLIFVSNSFPLREYYHQNSHNRPILLNLSWCTRDYTEAIKPSSKLTLPWNENIEEEYKQIWNKKLAEGTAKGNFPMPDASIKIDTPGFSITDRKASFFILDAQGKRVFPQDKSHARLEDIWDAYKNISTIPEEVLKLSYDKYVTKEPETPEKKDTETTSPSPAEAKPLEDVSKERAWTSSKNGKQITGKVIAYDGSTVTLRINNKNVQSPKTNFSNEDQDWLNQHQKAIQQAKINKQKTNGDSPNKELNENPVANAIKQANINRKANSKIKSQAKYFIFCWGTGMILTQKRFQLQAATMDCTKKDPHIQFILVSYYFSAGKTNPSNLRDFPIILDLASYSTSGDNDYRNAIKAGPQVKLPWNNIIEERQKRLWESNRKDGKVRGNFPLPDENRRINIPGYSPAVFTPSFFIVDSQGKRIVPKNGEGSSSLEGIWKAYTGITTLPEEDLQSSYRRYVEAQFRNDD